MNSSKEPKLCLNCSTPISGRADKKFCDDQCRNSYNNQHKTVTTEYMKSINNILRKNRLILSSLSPDGKSKVSKTQLYNKGFNFNFFTHIYQTKKGNIYHFCYDYGYFMMSDEYIYIVKDNNAENEVISKI
jgi:predicted nucleic acid-binding Zn ribbon protein